MSCRVFCDLNPFAMEQHKKHKNSCRWLSVRLREGFLVCKVKFYSNLRFANVTITRGSLHINMNVATSRRQFIITLSNLLVLFGGTSEHQRWQNIGQFRKGIESKYTEAKRQRSSSKLPSFGVLSKLPSISEHSDSRIWKQKKEMWSELGLTNQSEDETIHFIRLW